MFTCFRLSSIEYYLAANNSEKREQDQGRDRAAYYTDNDAEEDKGVWFNSSGISDSANRNERTIPLTQHGSEVDSRTFRTIANGTDPISGIDLVQRGNGSGSRMVGYDLQFAAPKSVSVLWVAGNDAQRKIIEKAEKDAVMFSLQHMQERELIVTRRGKGGALKEAPEEITAALFAHSTSRAGDPQRHIHAVLMNVCRRKDGTWGTIDNAKLLKHQKEMGAVYRLKLAEYLDKRLDIKSEKDGRNFRVVGVDENIEAAFSKRSVAIEKAAEKLGIDKSGDRKAAEMLTLATRGKKDELPTRSELEKRWDREIRQEGWTKDGIWESALQSARMERERDNGIYEAPSLKAIAEIAETEAVIEDRELVGATFEQWQGKGTVEDAKEDIERVKESGFLLEIGKNDSGQVYATREMINRERGIIRDAMSRRNEREWVSADQVEAAIARRKTMSDEQADAVRHALNRDGVSVVEGSAGTGKSFSLGAVADAARECGLHVYAVAPSHKAKTVLAEDTNTKESDTHTLRGFLNRITNPEHKSAISLSDRDVVLVDEAGMVGTHEMADLLRVARETGAKIILAGDTRQLKPVGAGSPMKAIAKVCGTQRIEEIRRQKVDWQREASMSLSRGEIEGALRAYAAHDRIRIESREDAIQSLVRDYTRDLTENRDATRAVITTKNADVVALNNAIRTAAQKAGVVSTDEATVKALSRGRDGTVIDLRIAAGDRLIFGAGVRVGGTDIRNNDTGTVVAFQATADADDPLVTIALDKGERVTCRWSDLAPPAVEGEPRPPVAAQHAYAVTIYSSQGMTVDRAFIFNSSMDQSSTYVAMTRHRLDATMYVDSDRIEHRIAAKERDRQGEKFQIDSAGRADGRDADPDAVPTEKADLDDEDLMSIVCHEAGFVREKSNASDYVPPEKLVAWAEATTADEALEIARRPAAVAAEPQSDDLDRKSEREAKRIGNEEIAIKNQKKHKEKMRFSRGY